MNKLKIIILTTLILISASIYSQNNSKISNKLQNLFDTKNKSEYSVFIFYKDKGNNLAKKMVDVEKLLPSNAIKRRKKLMKNKSSVATFYDIPLNKYYFDETKKYINKLRHKLKWLNAISAEVSEENIKKIANLSFVKKIDIVRKGTINRKNNNIDFSKNIMYNPFIKSPKNSKYNLNYGSSLTQLEQINVPIIHDMGYDGSGVIICVMDAGFNNLEHPTFNNMNIIGQYDFVNDDANVDDEGDMGTGNHGTMTLSTIGGFQQNQLIGPAYGANFILAKTENTDSETTIEEDNWVAAMQWAEDNYGPDVTSTSLGYIYFDDGTGYDASELDGNTATITIGADIAASLGILVVNSAGNSGSGVTTIGAPADGDSVLAVGAVYADNSRTYFSSVGPTGDGRIKPDVMAMGSNVYVAEAPSGSGYTTADGTSFSCPLTGGAAALLIQMVPTANNMEIIEAMKMTANNSSSPNNEYGWGIINVKDAYEYFVPSINHSPLSDTENSYGPYHITVNIISRSDLILNEQKLFWRRNNGAWQTVIMSSSKESGTFSADIPGDGTNANYDYYFTAQNTITTRTLPENAPSSFFSFSIITDNTFPIINHSAIAEYYKNLFPVAQINAEITDNTGINLQDSYVEWLINNNPQSNFNFTLTEGNNYSASFPNTPINIGDIIKYKIIATDNANSPHTTYYPTSGYNEFTITDRISFEQNQFSHNWIFSGDENWFITNTEHQDGSFSAKSGNINNNQESVISITFSCNEPGQVSFFKKVSCEDGSSNNWDFLKFSIDGVEKGRWDGEVSWSSENYNINAGEHILKWSYEKDVSISTGDDCAWIDNITLPESSVNIRTLKSRNFNLFPNPANEYITLDFKNEQENSNIEIYNQTGKLIRIINSYKNKSTIDVSNFSSGIYLCKLINKNSVEFVKFIISR